MSPFAIIPMPCQSAVIGIAESDLKVSDIFHEHAAHVDIPFIQAQRIFNGSVTHPEIRRKPRLRKPLLDFRF